MLSSAIVTAHLSKLLLGFWLMMEMESYKEVTCMTDTDESATQGGGKWQRFRS